MDIDDLVIAEIHRRHLAGFGPIAEVVISGHIAAFRAKLMQASAEQKWHGYMQSLNAALA